MGGGATALYTIWTEGTLCDKAIAVVHCTGVHFLIALGALTISLVIAGRPEWPRDAFRRVANLTIAFGLLHRVQRMAGTSRLT